MTSHPRRGSILPFAIVMMGVILSVVVGTMAWVNATTKRAQDDRWRVIAADAAQSGLSMMLAWARAHVDRTRVTPPEWDVGDGVVANPLKSLFSSAEFKGMVPAGALTGRDQLNIGTRAAPVEPGDVIEPNGAGEYVLGRYGDYVASIRVRLQPFRVGDNAPRQYKIAVAGRVRAYDANQTAPGPFKGSRLVADRVMVATVGKQPLSRFAALIDIDQIGNWVPGEVIEGPVHVNRGYIDHDPAVRPVMAPGADGRSMMKLNIPGDFTAVAGVDHPIFMDTVSVTARTQGDAPLDDGKYSKAAFTDDGNLFDSTKFDEAKSRAIFLAPENQAQIGPKAGPVIVEKPVQLPPNSRARLAVAIGMADGGQPRDLPWFPEAPDGVYVPTEGMIRENKDDYGEGTDYAAGGIYVRGQVELMRMAVKGDMSYYFFQVGFVHKDLARRSYMVACDRAAKTIKLTAFERRKGLRQVFTDHGGPGPDIDLDALYAVSNPKGDLDDFAVVGTAMNQVASHTFQANPGSFPFNGVIFVDYSLHDPIRGANPMDLTPPNNAVAPLTGQILALGDPGQFAGAAHTWRKFKNADPINRPGFLDAPEVVCTESTEAGTPKKATKLMIVAAGDVFIQNHLLVREPTAVAGLADASAELSALQRDKVSLRATRDMIGLVSDKQIVVGLGAPSDADRTKPGLLVMGALAALGDPAYDYRTGKPAPIPVDKESIEGRMFRFRGSFATEGLTPIVADDRGETYDILFPGGSTLAANLAGNVDPASVKDKRFGPNELYHAGAPDTWPYNPLYDPNGPIGGVAPLQDVNKNPNRATPRGKLTIFGSLVVKKRGTVGLGNMSYDKDYRYDNRLLTSAPPLFPNSLNIVTFVSRLDALGPPPYTGPKAVEAAILNN